MCHIFIYSSVIYIYCCCRSVAQSCLTLLESMDCCMSGLPVPHHLLEFAGVHVHCISDAIEPSYPCLTLLLLLSVFPTIRVFSSELAVHIRWPKYWSFSINPSYEYSGLISFKIDWFDLHAVQGTPKSLLQHHSLKTSIGRHSLFFTIQLSQLYVTTGKTIALTIRTFVGQVMSLLFNMLGLS